MSKKMIEELSDLKSKKFEILSKGKNINESLQKAVCGSNTKYATGK